MKTTKQPRQITGTNINEDEAKDRKFLESLPDYTPEAIPEGYTRSEHPETPSGYLTRDQVKDTAAAAERTKYASMTTEEQRTYTNSDR